MKQIKDKKFSYHHKKERLIDDLRIKNQIRFKILMLQSDLCDCSGAYIVVKETITFQTENDRALDACNRHLMLKNNALFVNCISKINNVLTDNAEDLYTVMPMYKLIQYSKNYSKTSGTFGIITRIFYLILQQILILLNITQILQKKTANDRNTKEV